MKQSPAGLLSPRFGIFFTAFTVLVTYYEMKMLGASAMSSEQFNTAGRNVGVGLTAAVRRQTCGKQERSGSF